MSENAIRTKELVKTFPKGVRALDGVGFDVAAGSVFGLVGPNGAGKSTTVKILTTLSRPDSGEAEVAEAGSALGRALAEPLRGEGVRGYGFGVMTSAEALVNVVLEVSDVPLVVSNVDLTQARIGGLGTDVARRFLERLADGAGLTLHVRLLNGTDSQHVLEAIFKALGVALAHATSKGEASG